MVRVQRPPIKANIGAKPARLDEPLRAVVASRANARLSGSMRGMDRMLRWPAARNNAQAGRPYGRGVVS